jgi:hypothetical protein
MIRRRVPGASERGVLRWRAILFNRLHELSIKGPPLSRKSIIRLCVTL